MFHNWVMSQPDMIEFYSSLTEAVSLENVSAILILKKILPVD